jgi:ribulose bisphosphate carboxylase small subunit
MGLFGDETEDTAEKTEELKQKEEELTKALNEQATAREKQRNAGKQGLDVLQRELQLLEARGAKVKEVFDKEQEIRREELQNLKIRFFTIQGNADQELELKKEIADKENEILAAQFAYERELREEEEKRRKDAADKRRKELEKEFEDTKKLNDLIIKNRLDPRFQGPPPAIEINREERLAQWQLLYDQQLLALKKSRYEGLITEKEYNKQVEQIEINALQSRLDTLKETHASQQDIVEAEIALFDAKEKQKTEIFREQAELRQQLEQQLQSLVSQGVDVAFEHQKARREEELRDIQEQREYELELAGDNAKQKELINKEYDRKERKIKRDIAKVDRDKALFDIAINTAVGIAKAIPNVPLIIFSTAIGLAQAAIVLSKPLPQYEKGTQNAEEGWAIVDEKGPELRESKGKFYLGSNKGPRLTYLNKGDKIYPAKTTEKILEEQTAYELLQSYQLGAYKLSGIKEPGINYDKITSPIVNALNNKPEGSINLFVDKSGIRALQRKGHLEIEHLNNRFGISI